MTAPGVLRFSAFDVTRQVFYQSKLSFAIVNLKPIVDNHVLVIPRRLAPRMSDLSAEEVSDLFQSVQTIGKTIEKATNAKSLTIACQDGPYAGQSVPHVHIHILPRHPQDFDPIDGIYDKLDSVDIQEDFEAMKARAKLPKDKMKLDSERQSRSQEDMEKEATWLASLFKNSISQ
ncbi:HIT-like protein [Cystobasidium minutum MCA 4210]|uniref:HIT-like protein n=1 Tax=Cystobasidium minutum MCA 4210 TaxID=1397322 RepID=UPI0034CFCBBF|eukprot:jgi/Rhomi1/184635/fgenesh1_pm.10_\